MSREEIRILRRKLQRARDNEKLLEISENCCSLASCLSEIEEYEEALGLYKESLSACERLEYKEGIILAHRMIAETCINLGYFEEALNHVDVFLKYARSDCNKVEEQRGLVLKGHVFFTRAEYLLDAKPGEASKVKKLLDQSMDAYRKSFAICIGELKDVNERERHQMKARLLQNKALVLIRQNKLDHAQIHLIRAVKICAKEKLKDTEYICYLSLGDLYLRKEEYINAVNVFEKAFELARTAQKKTDCLLAEAKIFMLAENLEKAKKVLVKAYKIKESDEVKKNLKKVVSLIKLEAKLCLVPDSNLIERKEMCQKIGRLYCALKIFKKGIKYYLNMLKFCQQAELSKDNSIKCYDLLCEAFINDKQYEKALFYCSCKVEILSENEQSNSYKTLLKLAKLQELSNSDFEDVYFTYAKAKQLATKLKNQKLKLYCLKRTIKLGKKFGEVDLVKKNEKELEDLKNTNPTYNYDSESEYESEGSDSDNDGEQSLSSDTDAEIHDMLEESDTENKEFSKPRERSKRIKFALKRNEKGETDLHVATIKGNCRRVKLLIEQGHPVNIRDTAGWTPLHEACNHGYLDIVNILLDSGADINDRGGPCCDGTTPLHDAASNGQLEIIDTLIKRGASLLVLNDMSQTPFQCLMAWRENTALDREEEAMFNAVVKKLQSPLDSKDVNQQHSIGDSKNEKSTGAGSSPASNDIDYCSEKNEIDDFGDFSRCKQRTNYRSDKHQLEDSDDSNHSQTVTPCAMYRNAIQSLRHKPKKFKASSVSEQPSQRALIDERNYVENCIVDNDEEEEVNEDSDCDSDIEFDYSHQKEKNSEDGREAKKKENRSVNHGGQVSNRAMSSPTTETNLEKSVPQSKSKSSFVTNVPSKQSENDFQSNSLEFLNEVLTPEFSTSGRTREDTLPNSIGDLNDDSNFHILKESYLSETVTLTVNVLDEEIAFPVKRSEMDKLKMDWLIKRIVKRYPVYDNPAYHVSLKIDGNADVLESDSLTMAAGRKIQFSGVRWKLLRLGERYEKACTVKSHPDITGKLNYYNPRNSPQSRVGEILKANSALRCFDLSNLDLTCLTLIPVCKALRYESFVQTLNLSNNHFGDFGMEFVGRIFQQCVLEELILIDCQITATGIDQFGRSLAEFDEIARGGLRTLNLSENPITDDAIESIEKIIENLPNLNLLMFDRCQLKTSISSKSFPYLKITQENCE